MIVLNCVATESCLMWCIIKVRGLFACRARAVYFSRDGRDICRKLKELIIGNSGRYLESDVPAGISRVCCQHVTATEDTRMESWITTGCLAVSYRRKDVLPTSDALRSKRVNSMAQLVPGVVSVGHGAAGNNFCLLLFGTQDKRKYGATELPDRVFTR